MINAIKPIETTISYGVKSPYFCLSSNYTVMTPNLAYKEKKDLIRIFSKNAPHQKWGGF
jgi:hypothetical protein